MASRGLNPMTVTTMILLVLTTVIFTVLFFTASNSLTKTTEGAPDDNRRKEPFDKVAKEVAQLRSDIALTQRDIQVRKDEIERLDVQLIRYGAGYSGENPIAATNGRELSHLGKTYNAKLSEWAMTLGAVTEVNQRLQYTQSQLETRGREIFAPLENEIDARSREQQQVLARANDMDAEYRTDEEKLLAIKDELEKKISEAEKRQRMDYSSRSSDINKKEDQIRSLLEIELRWLKELTPDGRILETVVADRTVVIDIGDKEHVIPGLLFDVFQYEQGRYVSKGHIEVVDVQAHIATARVLSEADGRKRPLAPGDYIGNPVFDVSKAPVFVLAGEFKQYNTEDLSAFIRATGGVISDTLQPGCDYLIAGERSEKVQDIAREYQIIAMTEEQLLNFVQPRFSVK